MSYTDQQLQDAWDFYKGTSNLSGNAPTQELMLEPRIFVPI